MILPMALFSAVVVGMIVIGLRNLKKARKASRQP